MTDYMFQEYFHSHKSHPDMVNPVARWSIAFINVVPGNYYAAALISRIMVPAQTPNSKSKSYRKIKIGIPRTGLIGLPIFSSAGQRWG